MPEDLFSKLGKALFPDKAKWLLSKGKDSKQAIFLQKLNDGQHDRFVTLETREREITKVFARHGIKVEFVGELDC